MSEDKPNAVPDSTDKDDTKNIENNMKETWIHSHYCENCGCVILEDGENISHKKSCSYSNAVIFHVSSDSINRKDGNIDNDKRFVPYLLVFILRLFFEVVMR